MNAEHKKEICDFVLENAPIIIERETKLAQKDREESFKRLIQSINWKKYKYEIYGEKYETIEQAREGFYSERPLFTVKLYDAQMFLKYAKAWVRPPYKKDFIYTVLT